MEKRNSNKKSNSGNKDWRTKSSSNRSKPTNNKKKESTLDNRVFVKKAVAVEDKKIRNHFIGKRSSGKRKDQTKPTYQRICTTY